MIINSLPDDRMLDLSNFKTVGDDVLTEAPLFWISFKMVENIEWYTGYSHLLFQIRFRIFFLSGQFKF